MPVFYFHGVPSSRLDFLMFGSDSLAERLGLRVVAVDRPGCGESDFQRLRKIVDWPADVLVLADSLGLDRFSVLGWSGGGPYALACAATLAGRVSTATVVSSLGPFDVPGLTSAVSSASMRFFRLNRDHPAVGRLFDRLMALGLRKGPEKFMARTLDALSAIDRDAMSSPQVAPAYMAAVNECFRSGLRGGQVDAAVVASPWDFNPHDIDAPVFLWHGGRDLDAPPAMGRWIAGAVPKCHAQFYSEEGHISLLVNRAESVLRCLVK